MKRRRSYATGIRAIAAWLLLCSVIASCASHGPAPGTVSAGELIGTWNVDLRPMPSADPYYQAFVVTSVEGMTNSTGRGFLAYWSAVKQ